MRNRRCTYLIWYCGFKQETLDMLNNANLKQLAEDYGFTAKRFR